RCLDVADAHGQGELGSVLRDRRLALERRLVRRHEARVVAAERRGGARWSHRDPSGQRGHDYEMRPQHTLSSFKLAGLVLPIGTDARAETPSQARSSPGGVSVKTFSALS